MTARKLTKEQLKILIRESADPRILNRWTTAVQKAEPLFQKAGFEPEAIDFTSIDPELIEMLAQTVHKYLERKSGDSWIKRALKT